MEKAYWLSRKRASLNSAQNAVGSEAKLIHYDLAGRYSVKASSAETQAIDLASALPPPIYAAPDHPSEGTYLRERRGDLADQEVVAPLKSVPRVSNAG